MPSPSLAPLTFRARARVLHPISPRLFGQFFERASFGEPGPELFADPTGALRPDVLQALHAFRPPVLRFPGGSDVDRIDWTDMVDLPERGERPITTVAGKNQITNRFGYDAFLSVCEALGAEALLVLNLADGLEGRRSPADAAQHAAGLVAYATRPVGSLLPTGMRDWPAVREKNGRTKPYPVHFIQLGNEWFAGNFSRTVPGSLHPASQEETAQWYIQVLHSYIRAIRAVAPEVPLIIDGHMGKDLERRVLADSFIQNEVRYVTFHRYAPGKISVVRGPERPETLESLSDDDVWYALCAIPGTLENGLNVGLGPQIDFARALGYRIACTEWNWNGSGMEMLPGSLPEEALTRLPALGAASFLHGLMRQGDSVDLATQSMFLGHHWLIASIRADPQGRVPPYLQPQGLVSSLYRDGHGDELHELFSPMLPGRPVHHVVGRWTRWPSVLPSVLAYTDLLVSSDARAVYVHAIHRHRTAPQEVLVDLAEMGLLEPGSWKRLDGETCQTGVTPPCRLSEEMVGTDTNGVLRLHLPPGSVSVVRLPRMQVP